MACISRARFLAALGAAAILFSGCGGDSPLRPPLTFEKNIQLPHDPIKPAIDLLTLDPRAGRLYVAHTSTASLDIIDTRLGSLLGSVAGLVGIKAIALSADPSTVFVSNAIGDIAVVDVNAMQVKSRIQVGGTPDAIDYDGFHDLVLVSLSSDKQLAVIDGKTQQVRGRIPLPGDPELITVDQHTGRVFMAIHNLDEVVLIDPVAQAITSTYRGCDIKAPTGLAFDAAQGRLFVADRKELSIIDVLLNHCLGAVDIGSGTDQIAFDPQTHHVYTADGGSKYISVIDSVTMKPLGLVGTGPSAATIAVDPSTQRIYVGIKPAGLIAVYHDP
jgi:DNA-binding beta-propeller fold protein YncE